MIDKLSAFLQANPWVVVISAFATLLPVVRWVFRKHTDVVLWISKDFKGDTEDVEESARNTSFYISTLITNIEHAAFFGFISLAFYWFSRLFKFDVKEIWDTAAWLLTLAVSSVSMCTAAAILIYTSHFSQSVGKTTRRLVEREKKK